MSLRPAAGETGVSWRVEAVTQMQLVELRFAGSVSEAELQRAVQESVSLAQRLGYRRFLADCRNMTSRHSPALLFQLASEVRSGPVGDTAREAVLIPDSPEALSSVRFWETTALNRGLVVRLFVECAEAMAWLMQEGGA